MALISSHTKVFPPLFITFTSWGGGAPPTTTTTGCVVVLYYSGVCNGVCFQPDIRQNISIEIKLTLYWRIADFSIVRAWIFGHRRRHLLAERRAFRFKKRLDIVYGVSKKKKKKRKEVWQGSIHPCSHLVVLFSATPRNHWQIYPILLTVQHTQIPPKDPQIMSVYPRTTERKRIMQEYRVRQEEIPVGLSR